MDFLSERVMECSTKGTSQLLLPQNDFKQLLLESLADKFLSPFDEKRGIVGSLELPQKVKLVKNFEKKKKKFGSTS